MHAAASRVAAALTAPAAGCPRAQFVDSWAPRNILLLAMVIGPNAFIALAAWLAPEWYLRCRRAHMAAVQRTHTSSTPGPPLTLSPAHPCAAPQACRHLCSAHVERRLLFCRLARAAEAMQVRGKGGPQGGGRRPSSGSSGPCNAPRCDVAQTLGLTPRRECLPLLTFSTGL